jgi:hypothetical protein
MFQVNDIYDEAKKIVGNCDEVRFFRWLGDAVTLIANKGDFEAFKGFCDICAEGKKLVTLPREVQTVLAVNIGGRPTLGFGQLFNFHTNGPGDCTTRCEWSWYDQGDWFCTYRDLTFPTQLVAYSQTPVDNGKTLIVFGFDQNGLKVRRQENGVWLDGWRLPLVYGYAIPDVDAPYFSRIIQVQKDLTAGSVRLGTIDSSGTSGTVLGIYEPDELLPQYRRIRLGRPADWCRIAYRRPIPVFSSRWDRIPLMSRIGFLNAVRAVKFYFDNDLANSHAYEADAARMELEAQSQLEAPTYFPLQVINRNAAINDQSDYDIRSILWWLMPVGLAAASMIC